MVLVSNTLFLSCEDAHDDLTVIKDVVIENHDIQEEQDLSNFFDLMTIVVSGKNKHEHPLMARTFDFFDNILYVVNRQPEGKVTAVKKDGTIKWQLKSQENYVSGFKFLDVYLLDRQNKVIKIFDDGGNRIFTYNLQGMLQSTEKSLGLYTNDVHILNDGNSMYSISAYKNDFEEDRKVALVAYSKKDKRKLPYSIILYNDLYDSSRMPYKDYNDFFTTKDGSLFYQRDFDSTIYRIEELTANPYIKFSFSENDRRWDIQSNPSSTPILLQELLNENIPYCSYAIPESKFFLASYVYNSKEIFTMIDLESKRTLLNTRNFTCDGKSFSGRMNYSNGILINQMYAGNYYQVNTNPSDEHKTVDAEDIIYSILIPKW